MAAAYLQDPLAIVQAASLLHAKLSQLGYQISLSDDAEALTRFKLQAREEPLTPYFDPAVSGLTRERFFWMRLSSSEIPLAGLQAFRLDEVSTSLADWAPAYTIGLYMQRGEILVPHEMQRTRNSIAHSLSGRLVYNGELWLAPRIKNRFVYETFSKLGFMLTLCKWIPDSIWALAEKNTATRGHPVRGGFSIIENGFFRWRWMGKGIPDVEWLHIIDKRSLEHLADQVCSESVLDAIEDAKSENS